MVFAGQQFAAAKPDSLSYPSMLWDHSTKIAHRKKLHMTESGWGCGALENAMMQLSLLSRSVRINVVFEEVNMKVLRRQGCRYARYSAFVGCGGLGWAGWQSACASLMLDEAVAG